VLKYFWSSNKAQNSFSAQFASLVFDIKMKKKKAVKKKSSRKSTAKRKKSKK
jgi:hypothetical protein